MKTRILALVCLFCLTGILSSCDNTMYDDGRNGGEIDNTTPRSTSDSTTQTSDSVSKQVYQLE